LRISKEEKIEAQPFKIQKKLSKSENLFEKYFSHIFSEEKFLLAF